MVGADAALTRVLHVVLVVVYAAVAAAVVIAVAAWGRRPLTSLGEVPWWAWACAVVLVALTWAPVSAGLGRSVHDLVHGQHDDAYRIVERVQHELHADGRLEDLLGVLAATVAQALSLPYVAIDVSGPDPAALDRPGGAVTVVRGRLIGGSEPVSIPLRYRSEVFGELRVGPRRRGGGLSGPDLRLLDGLARNVAITVHATTLSEAVRSSRAQLVTAREEERRRIRRDLHDGLGPTLASMRLQLAAARRTVDERPDRAGQLLADLQEDVSAATAEVRRLVDGLRPPMLDEFGLAGALRSLGPEGDGVTRVVDVPDPPPSLPAAVEVAAYRIAAEALTNVARHAGATTCHLTLTATPAGAAPREVTVTVADDGRGLPADYAAGVGHTSMRDRVAELGGTLHVLSPPTGGTVVTATLPSGRGAGGAPAQAEDGGPRP